LFTLIPQLPVLFTWAAAAVSALQAATNEGMKFLFGYLAGGPAPFTVTDPSKGFVLALQALPLVIIMSVLAKLLYHWGILQRVVALLASALQRTMGVSGPVGTASAANIFIGMVEAPIFIRPWLARFDKGGLFAVMTTGMATVAGTVMALYASFLEPVLPGAAGHILLASIMSAPAALVISRLMVPWQNAPSEDNSPALPPPRETGSVMDAIVTGTTDGIRLVVSIAAMLLVMVALVALVNMMLGAITEPMGHRLSVETMLGWLMTPLALLMGIPWSEAAQAGQLIGIKTVLNELLAYVQLASLSDSCDVRPLTPDPHLCPVRLRQLRLPRHHDWRPGGPVPGPARRHSETRSTLNHLWHARHHDDRRRHRRHYAGLEHHPIRLNDLIG
jgi:CNT family concentrative nucleoside transporter